MSVWSTDFKGCKYALGIDLGTTNSCVAMWRMEHHKAKVFKNFNRQRTFPSQVAFFGKDWDAAAGELVEKAAAQQAQITQTVLNVKRVMGLEFEDPSVAEEQEYRSYQFVPAQDEGRASRLQVKLSMNATGNGSAEEKTDSEPGLFYPEEVSAHILAHAKRIAEERMGQKITAAVVTIPAYFAHSQRKATRTAAFLAGFEKVRLLSEPTAGAMAYGLFVAGTKTVLVFDLGGGTLDTSLLSIDEGTVDVLATHGDSRVGGADIDKFVLEYVLDEVRTARKIERAKRTSSAPSKKTSLKDVARSLDIETLRKDCEKAKVALSTETSATVPVYPANGPGTLHKTRRAPECTVTISRSKLEAMCEPLFKKCIGSIDDCLKQAQKSETEVDEVVLVGGCTRIPSLRQRYVKARNVFVARLSNLRI